MAQKQMPKGSLSYGIVSIHLIPLKFLMQRSVSLQTDCSILIMTGLPPQPQPPLGPVPIHIVLLSSATLHRLPLPHPFPLRWAPSRDIGRNACLSLAMETPHPRSLRPGMRPTTSTPPSPPPLLPRLLTPPHPIPSHSSISLSFSTFSSFISFPSVPTTAVLLFIYIVLLRLLFLLWL